MKLTNLTKQTNERTIYKRSEKSKVPISRERVEEEEGMKVVKSMWMGICFLCLWQF